jgi:hypothetical protein
MTSLHGVMVNVSLMRNLMRRLSGPGRGGGALISSTPLFGVRLRVFEFPCRRFRLDKSWAATCSCHRLA